MVMVVVESDVFTMTLGSRRRSSTACSLASIFMVGFPGLALSGARHRDLKILHPHSKLRSTFVETVRLADVETVRAVPCRGGEAEGRHEASLNQCSHGLLVTDRRLA